MPHLALGQNRFGIPFWLVGDFTTHFRAYFSADWDVYWGYGILTHGRLAVALLWMWAKSHMEFDVGFPMVETCEAKHLGSKTRNLLWKGKPLILNHVEHCCKTKKGGSTREHDDKSLLFMICLQFSYRRRMDLPAWRPLIMGVFFFFSGIV